MVDDLAVILVNGFGLLTSLIAIGVYWTYGGEARTKVEYQLLLHLLTLFGFLALFQQDLISSAWISLAACASSIAMYAAPLSTVQRICRTGDTEALSIRLILITFLVCFTWFVYGVNQGDLYIVVPNGFGTILALLQYGLKLYFGGFEPLANSPKPYEMVSITAV